MATVEINSLSDETLRKLAEVVRRVLPASYGTLGARGGYTSSGNDVFIAKTPGGGIPASSGTTPGSAVCDIYYIDDAGDYAQKLDGLGNAVTITVYNLAQAAAVGNSVFIQVKQENFGSLLCDWEECE